MDGKKNTDVDNLLVIKNKNYGEQNKNRCQ